MMMTIQYSLDLIQAVIGCMSHKQPHKNHKNLEQPIHDRQNLAESSDWELARATYAYTCTAKFAPRSNYAICQKLGSGLGID